MLLNLNEGGIERPEVVAGARGGLKTVSKDQTLKIRIITQRRQVLIMLGAHPQVGLNIQRPLQRFQCEIN